MRKLLIHGGMFVLSTITACCRAQEKNVCIAQASWFIVHQPSGCRQYYLKDSYTRLSSCPYHYLHKAEQSVATFHDRNGDVVGYLQTAEPTMDTQALEKLLDPTKKPLIYTATIDFFMQERSLYLKDQNGCCLLIMPYKGGKRLLEKDRVQLSKYVDVSALDIITDETKG